MHRIIGVSELRRGLHKILDEVVRKRTPVILAQGKHPQAALIPYEDYLDYQELRESVNILRFHETRTRLAQITPTFGDE